MESQKKYQKKFSFEFFPPRTQEASEKLELTQARLAKLNPDFISVTFGAGGSTRDKTFETVVSIKEKTGVNAVPHLSCIGSDKGELRDILLRYKDNGLNSLVALRGDLPSGAISTGELHYASELVEFIRAETHDFFHIEVACYPEFHPQSKSPKQDLESFKRKVDAGANSAITQYFFNTDAYFYFIDSCEKLGVDIPIVPGIMPITNYNQLARFSDMCGAEIPRWILRRLQGFADDKQAIQDFGLDVVSELCQKLLNNGAPGIHIYTMNRADTSEAIYKNLGLDRNS